MLAEWLSPFTVEEFSCSYLHRSAWAAPHSAHSAVGILDWSLLGEVLANARDADTIVCAQGRSLPFPPPRDLAALRAYMRMGVGLCLRHTQRSHPKLASLAAQFQHALPGTVQVQIFVTPAGAHGFGWHYDAEDVFIAQTAGRKDYYFRENTVEADAPFPPPDFNAYHAERSQLRVATLVPGDFLYIPARWWHMAVSREDSLSISVGVVPTDRALLHNCP